MTDPGILETTSRVTSAQRTAVAADHAQHAQWLQQQGITEAVHGPTEATYTGMINAALLEESDTAAAVLAALLAGGPARPGAVPVPGFAYAPSRPIDLVVAMRIQSQLELLIAEHKRYGALSNVPGKKRNPDGLWQTDVAYENAMGLQPVGADWLDATWRSTDGHRISKTFVVLDVYGRPMEQLFWDGLHNHHWTVTSYAQFGQALRQAHERGVPHLVPLLAALYTGNPHH